MKRFQRTTLICVLSAAAAMTYGVAGMAQTAIQSDPGASAPARDIAVAVKGQQTLMLDVGHLTFSDVNEALKAKSSFHLSRAWQSIRPV